MEATELRTKWPEFSNEGKVNGKKIMRSEYRNKSKGSGPWEWKTRTQFGKLIISVMSLEITLKNYSCVYFIISSSGVS